MTSRTEKAAHAIKASHILKDFHQEHLEAVDREQEQLKLKCVSRADSLGSAQTQKHFCRKAESVKSTRNS
jgi:hypothetical protein